MKLPKRIKVGPFSYRVKFSSNIHDGDGRQLAGQIRYHSLIIDIDPNGKNQRLRETLMHEAIHAVTHDRKLDLDESFVHSFSLGMSALLVDNPELVRLYLKDRP